MSADQQQVVTALVHSFLATPFIARDELAQQITDIGFRNGLAPNALTIDQVFWGILHSNSSLFVLGFIHNVCSFSFSN
jgi:hypothetical protein